MDGSNGAGWKGQIKQRKKGKKKTSQTQTTVQWLLEGIKSWEVEEGKGGINANGRKLDC